MTEHGIHTDLTEAVAVDSSSLPWRASPSGTVWRKRFYLDGPPESGKVTSLVRYEPNARFPAHDHPQGEEIFVLEGVFSDEHGDWSTGSYLLNPEGFHHAPFSREGCLIFVRLRQHPGNSRTQISLNTAQLPWLHGENNGIQSKLLYSQPDYPETVRLEKWARGKHHSLSESSDVEIFILEGKLSYESQTLGKHSWLRIPHKNSQPIRAEDDCQLLIMTTQARASSSAT